jgi:hypothetical protein
MALGRASAFGLQRTAQAKHPARAFLHTLPREETIVAGHSNPADPHVYPDHLGSGRCGYLRSGQRHDEVQPVVPRVGVNHQVGGVEATGLVENRSEVGGDNHTKAQSPASSCQTRLLVVRPEGTTACVVPYRPAPMDGVVTSRSAQAGETATAGMPLLTIANLDEVTLVIYVPETRVGQVSLGEKVEVQVDSFPGRVFVGEVANIAGEAEFTPRNVQTQEERVNLVFAVKVSIPNPGQELKLGMPADATIGS